MGASPAHVWYRTWFTAASNKPAGPLLFTAATRRLVATPMKHMSTA